MEYFVIETDRDKQTYKAKLIIPGLVLEDFQINSNGRFGIESRKEVLASFEDYEIELTDFMSSTSLGGIGFIVSEKVKNILSKHFLPKHTFVPLKIKDFELVNYYIFFIDSTDISNFIEFDNSLFFLAHRGTPKRNRQEGYIKLSSFKEKFKINKEYKREKLAVYIEQISLNSEFKTNIKWDIFEFPGFLNTYFSERLIKEFEKNDVTGYKSKKTNKIKRLNQTNNHPKT